MSLKLILQVSGGQKLEIGDPQCVFFSAAGGRIGRALDCDWVLSSRYISRHHATVSCVSGVFYIESLGENGVALNDSQQRLRKRERRALNAGDRLFIDQYEISVTIQDTNAVRQSSPAWPPRTPAPVMSPPFKEGRSAEPQAPLLDYSLCPTEGTSVASTPTAPSTTRTKTHEDADLAELPALHEPVLPNVRFVTAEPAYEPTELPARSSPSTIAFDAAAFLNGAGVDPAVISPDMAYTLGQIVRISIQGVVDLLRERTQFRNEFRLPSIGVQAAHNNPLKVAAGAEEALATLLRPRMHGYLPPLQALVDAVNDIRFHQIALVTGMRAGFDGVTSRFDPKKLVEQCERSGRSGISRLGSKARYWEEYVGMFEDVAVYPDTAFQRLFREEFSDAYQRHLDELMRNPDSALGPRTPTVYPQPA